MDGAGWYVIFLVSGDGQKVEFMERDAGYDAQIYW